MSDVQKNMIVAGAGGGGCFRKGTQIQLEHGKAISIEELKEGDEVLAFDEGGNLHVAKVTKLHYHADVQPILRVKFWNGDVHITPNHWVLNQYGSFVEMGKLTEHDALIDGMGHLRPIISAELIGHEPVWNLTVEPHHTFIADGIRVHNGGHRERYPVISGAGGGGGDSGKGGGGRAAVEDPDSLQSRAVVSLLDLLGEGQIGGLVAGAQSIFLNDTPLQNADGSLNFNGFSWAAKTGEQNQYAMPGFSDVQTPYNVGVQVKTATSSTVTVTNPNVDQVRVIVSLPALASTDMSTGDVHGTTVQYSFAISTDGGAFVNVETDRVWTGVGSWGYEDGIITAYRSAGSYSLSAGVSISADGDCAVQPEYWSNFAWHTLGGVLSLNQRTVQEQAVSYNFIDVFDSSFSQPTQTTSYVTGNTSASVTAPTGAEKIRFRIVSASGAVMQSVNFFGTPIYGSFYTTPAPSLIAGAVSSFVGISTCSISGKTRSRYQRAHMLAMPKPGSSWSIRMTRITADSTTSALSNDTYFDSYLEIVNARLNYPNSALVGISIDSSQFNSIPTRSYLVDGLYIKVPSNYNAATRVYTGVWDGTFTVAPSNNPAWVLYDILTSSRYGLGQFITSAQVDKAMLYQIGRYCDEMVSDGLGGGEPRFVCNTVIAGRSEAYKLISELTSVFRGMSYWNGGMVGFTQDAPTDTGMIFNQSNVIDGVFSYTGSSRKNRHSVALVTWNDPTQNYKQVVEYVEDAELVQKWGVRKIDMVAIGCTSRGQANRVGRWILYTEKYESEIITFKVGTDAAMVLPGNVVAIHDSSRAGKRMGGRLVASTLTSATLDAPITIDASGSVISIRMPDGSFSDRTVLEAAGTHSVMTWITPLVNLPVASAIWMIAESLVKPMLARVIGIAQEGTNLDQFTIVALEHNPSKYAAIESGLQLEPRRISIIDVNAVSVPTDLSVSESTYQVAPAVLGTKLYVSWTGNANSYEIKWRRTGKYQTNWQLMTSTSTSIELENVRKGTHEFSLVAVNLFGKKTQPIAASYDVLGKTTAPGDVVNFKIAERTSDLLLTWNPVTDIDLSGYEVRVGASWDSGAVIVAAFSGTMLTHDQDLAGIYYYHIRSIDTTGNYSDNVTTTMLDVVAPVSVSGFDCVQNGSRIEFRWNANTENDIVGYELREGATWSSSVFLTQVNATSYSTSANSVAGVRTFWIKAIASPGIYSVSAVFSTTDIAVSSDRNIILTDNEKALGWLGSKFNVSALEGRIDLDIGKTYGEYTWGISFPQAYRARNSIMSSFDVVLGDTANWSAASYEWIAPDATREWSILGDLSFANLSYYISKWVGLDPSYAEGFRLNAQTTGENGTIAAQSIGVTYSSGRFLKGAVIGDFARLNWNITVPSVFTTTFWAIPQSISGNQVYWSAKTATGLQLLMGHDYANGWFYLEDTLGNKLTIPYAIAVGDRILVGIVQTAIDRKLYVGKLGGISGSTTASCVPLGDFVSVLLHQ